MAQTGVIQKVNDLFTTTLKDGNDLINIAFTGEEWEKMVSLYTDKVYLPQKTISPKGIALIREFEGLRLKAYKDSAGIPTIGYGTIRYPDGTRVKMGDTCTKEQAAAYQLHDLKWVIDAVDTMTTDELTQNQFDALCSFVYNVGATAYRDSTLRKKVNANPADRSIRQEFARWNKAGGKVIQGLVNRRQKEAALYFS